MVLEKVAWMNLLFDFYGQLLTGKQRDTFELYYSQNLSLGEIADEIAVTRQAIHDTLKRTVHLLVEYEEKLGLAAKYLEQQQKLQEVVHLLHSSRVAGEPGRSQILQAQVILQDLLEV
jgi:predicted DNA-binding protein YlxM (UPF0122 family)